MKRIILCCEHLNKEIYLRNVQYARSAPAVTNVRNLNSIGNAHSMSPYAMLCNASACGTNRLFDFSTKTSTTTTTTRPKEACWNCKKVSARKELMFCGECGHLQDVDNRINYFEVLKLPQEFSLERKELTKRFRQIQNLVHPDRFSTKSVREQLNSAAWSSFINIAYKTLLLPVERAQYLLKLNGETISESNSSLDKIFLMNMMERNEQVEDASTEATLKELRDILLKEKQEKTMEMELLFKRNDIAKVKQVLVEMKYLISIENTIKNKLQNMVLKL